MLLWLFCFSSFCKTLKGCKVLCYIFGALVVNGYAKFGTSSSYEEFPSLATLHDRSNKQRMKLKELESCLQEVEGFDEPKIHLEQYNTSPHIASHMLYTINNTFNDISGNIVADFGCGCGVLAIGCSVLSAAQVVGIDIDPDALEIAKMNMDQFELEQIQLILADVVNSGPQDLFRTNSVFDTVIMNPPFGTKNNKGLDMLFVQRALDLCNGSVYSLHKSSTRDYVTKKCKEWNSEAEVLARLRFDLPKSYKFHKRQSVDVDVDFVRFNHL